MPTPNVKTASLLLFAGLLILIGPVLAAGPPRRHAHPRSRHASSARSHKTGPPKGKPGRRSHARPSHAALAPEDRKQGRKRRDDLRHKLHGLHNKIHTTRARIHEARVKEVRITETIQTVEGRMAHTRQNLLRVDGRLEDLGAQHEQVVVRLESTRAHLALRKQVLAQRLRSNYERQQATYLQTLLLSRSLHELLSRHYYVHLIVKSDAELIAGIQSDIRQIEGDKKLVEAQEQEQKALAAELETQKAQYAADLSRKRILLHGVQNARVQAEQELDEMEAEANAMNDRIRILSEMLRRQQEAARRAAQARARHGGRGRKGAAPAIPGPIVWHGGFIRPCAGPQTSGFGMRFHPILHRMRMHTGVDFAGGFGAPIHAAAGGIVLLSAYSRGYGNCIVLDHGGGVTTLYGHCSERLVREGETVRQGQLIARIGATGLATGPHLHFELRRNGVPVPP